MTGGSVAPVMVTATTRLHLVIGRPVRHSLSPVIHNAAFEALGETRVFAALEVPAEAVPALFEAVRRTDGIDGISVTTPCKQSAAAAVDRLSEPADRLRAVNTVAVSPGGVLVGANTDGEGLVAAVRSLGCDLEGARVLLLGAGGAARAAAVAMAEARVDSMVVVARRLQAAKEVAELAGGSARAVDGVDESTVADSDLVVNATVVGMAGGPAPSDVPFDLGGFRPGQWVFDMVYQPLETPLMRRARRAGASVSCGLPMLVHQAAAQIRIWTGREAPVGVMTSAAECFLRQTPR
ncbi:MAG: shikimate dehydrogenase (NADP(+)) [Acidimicrobiales bacterium]|nr:MAG: shikimate dehydrogenase (NADP(+)) [Acidimicrobiales bacterium]